MLFVLTFGEPAVVIVVSRVHPVLVAVIAHLYQASCKITPSYDVGATVGTLELLALVDGNSVAAMVTLPLLLRRAMVIRPFLIVVIAASLSTSSTSSLSHAIVLFHD